MAWHTHSRCRTLKVNRLPSAPEARALAQRLHPAWHRLSASVQRLMARNVNQILGPELDDPVRFVLCWAPGSRMRGSVVVDVVGGTGLAASRGIPVYNRHEAEHRQRIEHWINRLPPAPMP